MKLLMLFAATVTLCAGNVIPADDIPTVPGDNSHYVEGVSRYIWFPDGKGVPRLVDLQEQPDEEEISRATRSGANNIYLLYTRYNPTTPQILVNGNLNSVISSNFNPTRGTKVIAHGWTNDGNSDVNRLLTQAFLAAGDVNVIVVDWNHLAGGGYLAAVRGVPDIGVAVGQFMTWLLTLTNSSWSNVHYIGHSLGAHVVGNAGRASAGQPARVTGLDPAGPLWITNSNRLLPDAGTYVEAIHTDGGLLGIFNSVADADFYPNGGRNPQPGCPNSSCSHSRAYELFAASVMFDHLPARACQSIGQVSSACTGAQLNLGNDQLNKRGSGLYSLTTGASWPF